MQKIFEFSAIDVFSQRIFIMFMIKNPSILSNINLSNTINCCVHATCEVNIVYEMVNSLIHIESKVCVANWKLHLLKFDLPC